MKNSLSRPAKLSASFFLFFFSKLKLSNEELSSAKKCPLEMENVRPKDLKTCHLPGWHGCP